MIVKFKKLNEKAKMPQYGTIYSAGADLYSTEEKTAIPPHKTVFIGTGLAMEIPQGYVGLIFARSGLACKRSLAPANKVGVIDADYRGEIKVALHNHSDEEQIIEEGERVAQLTILPYITAQYEEVETLEDTVRGAGGFGSTGKV